MRVFVKECVIRSLHDSALYSMCVKQAQFVNVKYIKHCEQLEDTCITPENCVKTMQTEYYSAWQTKFVCSVSCVMCDSRMCELVFE